MSAASAASARAAFPKNAGMAALTPSPHRHVRNTWRGVSSRLNRSCALIGSSRPSAELIFGRAHDQMQQHSQRLFEVGLRDFHLIGAELRTQKVDQPLAIVRGQRDPEE